MPLGGVVGRGLLFNLGPKAGPPAMRIYGLTGNTGTGKTKVADLLRQRGIAVIDAVPCPAHVSQAAALDEIVRAFGPQYLDDHGRLRRQDLGRLIFADSVAKKRLEAITHPRIAQQAMIALDQHRQSGAAICVYDSAILVETGLAKAFDGLVVVTATPEQQVQRIVARDGLPSEDAWQRVRAQLPLEEKVKLADRVIDNSGGLEALAPQVDALVAWMGRTR
jgi:dephospho-CoA kinase